MKKLLLVVLALFLSVSVGAASNPKGTKKAAAADSGMGKAATLTGWVSDEKCGAANASADKADCAKKCIAAGQKIVFVTDKDKKVLNVQNPEVLKGHEGHHVKVSAHVDESAGSIHVMNVSMLGKTGKKAAAKS